MQNMIKYVGDFMTTMNLKFDVFCFTLIAQLEIYRLTSYWCEVEFTLKTIHLSNVISILSRLFEQFTTKSINYKYFTLILYNNFYNQFIFKLNNSAIEHAGPPNALCAFAIFR